MNNLNPTQNKKTSFQIIKRYDKGDFLNEEKLTDDLYQILDIKGFDIVGEYVTLKESKYIISDYLEFNNQD